MIITSYSNSLITKQQQQNFLLKLRLKNNMERTNEEYQQKIERCQILGNSDAERLFKKIEIKEYNIEIFQNSHLFHNYFFQQLYLLLKKWNLVAQKYSHQSQHLSHPSYMFFSKNQFIYSKIYEELRLIVSKPLAIAQFQVEKFAKLTSIKKLISNNLLPPAKMPKSKTSQRAKSMETKVLEKIKTNLGKKEPYQLPIGKENRQRAKTLDFKDDSYKKQTQILRNFVEKRQMDLMVQRMLKNKARFSCERIKMRGLQPIINPLHLQYGASKYKALPKQSQADSKWEIQRNSQNEEKSIQDQVQKVKNNRKMRLSKSKSLRKSAAKSLKSPNKINK